jgi:hypothetical protein
VRDSRQYPSCITTPIRHPATSLDWRRLSPPLFFRLLPGGRDVAHQPVGDYATTVIKEVRWLIDQYRTNPDAQPPAGLHEGFFTGSFDYTAEDFHPTAAVEPG